MFGKYHDGRVYEHFVHTYSRVPYLDTEISNLQSSAMKSSKSSEQRANVASQGIKKASEKAELLSKVILESRINKEKDEVNFISELHKTQEQCLQKQKENWLNYQKQRQRNQLDNLRSDIYLQNLLKRNAAKAESRLGAVRKWQ